MNIEKLLREFSIPTAHPGDKNYREGWVNVTCPFCSDHSMHLGFNISQGYAHCWRCEGKFLDQAVSKLLGVSIPKANQILKEYGGSTTRQVKEVKRKIRAKSHKLPFNTTKLKTHHKRYLIKRNFDPEYIEYEWKVLGTGPISKLDNVDYKHRILVPIYWNETQVSFQARDITEKNPPKYKACPEDRELIKHKHILYGRQDKWTDVGIAVEGFTDVWRLGFHAFATFGIAFTHRQVREMAKQFSRIIIIFDDEPQAQKQANLLQAELRIRGVEAVLETIEGDPGGLSERDAKNIIKKIL